MQYPGAESVGPVGLSIRVPHCVQYRQPLSRGGRLLIEVLEALFDESQIFRGHFTGYEICLPASKASFRRSPEIHHNLEQIVESVDGSKVLMDVRRQSTKKCAKFVSRPLSHFFTT